MRTRTITLMCMLVLGMGITAQASPLKAEASRFAAASVPTLSVNDFESDKQALSEQLDKVLKGITAVENELISLVIPKSESVWDMLAQAKAEYAYCKDILDAADSEARLREVEVAIASLQVMVTELQNYAKVLEQDLLDKPIVFADARVKWICVNTLRWDEDEDGELTRREASMVTDIGTFFREYQDITSFNELEYFTGLTNIPGYAFENCTSLTEITLPYRVTSIGEYAFAGSGLQKLMMSSNVESIGEQAFGNMNTAQVDITIDCASEHPVIADNLFCNYEYIFSAIKSVKLESGITSIGLHAFDYCTGMNSITIPSTVTSIGGSAFQNCESLTSVNIPRGVTTIGEGLFYNCRSLTETVIPEGVTSIWAGAFGNCSALESITIPSTVTSIGQSQWGNSSAGYTFSGCTSLETIRVDAVDPPELTKTNVFDENTYTNAELVVPANSTAAYAAAEGWSNFTHQTLSYDYVDEQGVVYRYDVTEDGKATVIGYRGTAVTVSIPESITVGGITYPVTIIANGAFQYSSMKILNLTTNVWFIYQNAFVDYEHQEDTPTINITVSPTSTNTILGGINEYGTAIPFASYAYGINAVNIGEGITKIASSVFSGSRVKLVTVPSTVTVIDGWAFNNSPMLEQVNLSEGLQTIGNAAFMDCVKLSYVNIPKTVTLIDNSAFKNCTALTDITIPSGVTALNTEVFAGCTNLKYVTIPTTVRTIAEDAFYNNGNVIDYMTITPTETETTIADRLFEFGGGFYFKRLILQEGITEIGDFAFWGGNLLEQVNLPESLQKIGEYAFQGCSELKNMLFIPKAVTSIGAGAFDGCRSLNKMQVYWNTPLPVSGNPFPTRENITLTIPFGALEAYLVDDYWKDFIFEESDIYIDENGLMYYPDKTNHTAQVAYNKGKVVEADIVESFTAGGQTYQVTSISGSAWIWDLGLIAVTIPKTVMTINDQAFNSCANLNTITVYATTPPTLGSQVFDNQASGRDIHENACLYVPKGTVEAYRTAWGFTHVYEIVSGDANGDGVVTIADAMAIVNYILGQPLDGFVEANADVNGDGKITIADAVSLVNMILN